MDYTEGSIASKYKAAAATRETFLEHAREIDRYTVRCLFEEGTYDNSPNYRKRKPRGHSDFPGYLVESLSNKLVYAIFPPTEPVIRLQADPLTVRIAAQERLADLAAGGAEQLPSIEKVEAELESKVEAQFVMREQAARIEFDSLQLRKLLLEDIKSGTMVAGQNLMYIPLDPKETTCKLWRFDKHVTKRDGSGNVYWWAAYDNYHKESLPKEVQDHIDSNGKVGYDGYGEEGTCDIYVCGYLKDGKWVVEHEAGGTVIESMTQEYPKDLCPFQVAGGVNYYDSHYSRGFCDTYMSSFRKLEGLEATLAAINANINLTSKIGLRKGSGQNPRRLLNAQPFVVADPNDYFRLTDGVGGADSQVITQRIDALENFLSKAFLQVSTAIRQSERTTALEVSLTREDLEAAGLGAHYAAYNERVLWVYTILMERSKRKAGSDLPDLPDWVVPVVATGSEALGRSLAGGRLLRVTSEIAGATNGQAITEAQEIARTAYSSAGFRASRYAPSSEEVAQARQAEAARLAEIQALQQQASQPMPPQ